jgi:2-oxoisovalerate dehydrogenase E1 component
MSKLIKEKAPAQCRRLETTKKDLLEIDRQELVRMLFLMHLIREFEIALLDLAEAGLVHGPAHTSVGQEAIAAATALVLRKTDMVGSTHRAHGHFLAKAFVYHTPEGHRPLQDPVTPKMQESVNRTLAEIMGLKAGWCSGRGGSMHLYDGESGNLGSNAIVGGGIPLATGAAWAQTFLKTDKVVVSFFGDGAMNQGCFHEVANMAALWGVPVLYFVENNLYAVGTSTKVSTFVQELGQRSLAYGIDSMIVDGNDAVAVHVALSKVTEQMRRKPFPFLIEGRTYRHYHHAGRMAGHAFGYRTKEEEEAWLAKDPIDRLSRALVEEAILSQEDAAELHRRAKASVAEAIAFSTAEKDGKRYIPEDKWPPAETLIRDLRCEEDLFSGARFLEKEDVDRLKPATYVDAIAAVTLRNMERDERVIVLGEEVANLGGGAYKATRGIKEVFADRLINTPISECGFSGMAGGAASVGLRPVVEIMFPDFALVASDQLFNQIGKLRYMYGGCVSFPLVVRTRIAIGFGYGGQHSMSPPGLFGLFSGWRVMAPSNAFDCVGLFNTAMRLKDPVLILEHGKLYPDMGAVPEDDLDYCIPYGKAKVVREGRDVTVLTYLKGVKECLEAAAALEAEGLSAEVIDLRTLDYLGMDYATIGESVKKTGSVLIVEETPRSMGLAGRISDEIQERFFDYLDCPVGKVAAPDIPPPVSRALEEVMIPSVADIKARMAQGARHASG